MKKKSDLVKVVFDDGGGEIRYLIGFWEDMGWAIKVYGFVGDYFILPKSRLVKIARPRKTILKEKELFGDVEQDRQRKTP